VKVQAIDGDVDITKCSKWTNSSKNATNMTKQSFGPIWHHAIMQKNDEMIYNPKNIKIVP
jgi:hypothetical protein